MKTNKFSKYILDNLTTRDVVDCGQKIGEHGYTEYTIAYDTHNGTRRSIYHVDEHTYQVAVSKLIRSFLNYTANYGVYVPSEEALSVSGETEYVVNYAQFIRIHPYNDTVNQYYPIITNESEEKMNKNSLESGQGLVEYCVIACLLIFVAAVVMTFAGPLIGSVIDQLKALFVL